MTLGPAARRAESLRLFARVVGIAVTIEGLAVLAGWTLEIGLLKSGRPGLEAMKPNTALALVLLGFSLRLRTARDGPGASRRWVDAVLVLVAVLGLMTVLEHLWRVDFGIDQILFTASVLQEQHPGPMAFLTAVSLMLLAITLSLDGRKGRGQGIAEAAALVVAWISLVALTGYAYGVQSLYALAGQSSMALPTALGLLLLALGTLASHPEHGIAAIVVSDNPGGRAARRLLPVAAVLPFILGWLRVGWGRASLYDAAFGTSLLVLALIAIFTAVILWNALSLDRLDHERRIAEDAVREKGRVLKLILDSMTDGVAVADAQGQFLVFNRAAEEILGVDAGKTGPEGWSDRYGLFLEDGTTPFPSMELPLARAIRGEEVTNVEMITRNPRRPEGAWLKVSARPLQDPQGGLQGGMALFSDVTEGRRLDEARRRAQEMETASRRAQQASRLKSEFLANMSHELRTPLNAVIGFAEILHDAKVGPVTADQKEFLGDILRSSRHLLQLINDVLDLSKVEAGKMEFRPERVDMPRLVGEVCDILRSIAAGKRIRVETDIESALGEIVIDPGKLKQVLYNYLSNALKFTAEEGRVTVRVKAAGSDFRLEVEDTGIGIDPSDLKRLFVEFQQLDASAAKKYAGTGLGLALTRRLVEAQGGRAGARSTLGQGSTFYAVLPRAASSAIVSGGPASVPSVSGGPAVLVVEDDKGDREWVAATLSRAGYVVEAVASGTEAIALAHERGYDAITLDMLLPDGDGRDVLAALRTKGPNVDTPVIVLTVVAEPGILAGFHVQEIIAKPASAAHLLASVARARSARVSADAARADER